MVASDSFAEFLREQLAPLGRVTMRRMFGRTGVFCDGLMLGIVSDDTLYFRVDEDNRAAFKEAESFPPLNYQKQGATIDLIFWRAPERVGCEYLVFHRLRSYAASRSYSWMSPPSTSRHRTGPHAALGAEGIGVGWPSPRCGRAWL